MGDLSPFALQTLTPGSDLTIKVRLYMLPTGRSGDSVQVERAWVNDVDTITVRFDRDVTTVRIAEAMQRHPDLRDIKITLAPGVAGSKP